MPTPEAVSLAAAWRPEWPAPPGVRALFTTRTGGVSQAPFNTLNLGEHVGDDPQAVAVNRAALASTLGVRPVFLQQVHGTEVVKLDVNTPDGTQADACVCTEPGLACTVMVADCLPLLFTDTAGSVVAAAHAGWRGLAAAATCFTALPAGKWLADLAALARLRLQALGIERVYGNDSSARWCTVGQASDFFSHRRDAVRLGSTGRMAACIWLA